MTKPARAASAALALIAFAAAPARGEEGMWTFDNFPAEAMRAEMGWAPDAPWRERVMASTARIPGCSASVVGARGLVLTNQHCVTLCLQSISGGRTNQVETGFAARAPGEERRCAGLAVQVLEGVSDVTARINAAAADTENFARARDREIGAIEGECAGAGRRCEVQVLYQGGRYALHTYRRYEDVRLVFAPDSAAAGFGGDADNFSFPRHGLDFAFLRLYWNGAAAETPQHLQMRFAPPEAGEIALVAGNPGATSRLRTGAELAFERDVNLPWRIDRLSQMRDRVLAFAARGPEAARAAASVQQETANTLKAMRGRLAALEDEAGFARILAGEQDLRERVARNQAATRAVGEAWSEIAAAQDAYRALFHPYQYLEARAGEGSLLFAWARELVRGAAERERPDGARLPRYTQARLPGVAYALRMDRPADARFEAVVLELWLEGMRRHLPGDGRVARMLGGRAPGDVARALAASRLGDPVLRQALWDGGAAAIAASNDPMIVFVRAMDGDARAVRAHYEAQVERPVALAQERIARARFQSFGTDRYPEPTFSPRLSFGRIEGWQEADGLIVQPFTRLDEMFARATGAPPFVLSPAWAAARARLDGETIFNLVSSTDAVAGNSGSPLLDREARVIGVVFDGNSHSLGGEYFYDGARNRTVSLAASAIRAALADVYGMDALLAELEAR